MTQVAYGCIPEYAHLLGDIVYLVIWDYCGAPCSVLERRPVSCRVRWLSTIADRVVPSPLQKKQTYSWRPINGRVSVRI